MSDFTNDAEKVLAKAQSLRDRCSHSYLGAAHLAVGLVEGPDATLKKLYKSKGVKTSEPSAVRIPSGWFQGQCLI